MQNGTCSCGDVSICYHVASLVVYSYGNPAFKISVIFEYLGHNDRTQSIDYAYGIKTLERAENAISSNHLCSFESTGVKEGRFRGKVAASMKQQIRDVEVCILSFCAVDNILFRSSVSLMFVSLYAHLFIDLCREIESHPSEFMFLSSWATRSMSSCCGSRFTHCQNCFSN